MAQSLLLYLIIAQWPPTASMSLSERLLKLSHSGHQHSLECASNIHWNHSNAVMVSYCSARVIQSRYRGIAGIIVFAVSKITLSSGGQWMCDLMVFRREFSLERWPCALRSGSQTAKIAKIVDKFTTGYWTIKYVWSSNVSRCLFREFLQDTVDDEISITCVSSFVNVGNVVRLKDYSCFLMVRAQIAPCAPFCLSVEVPTGRNLSILAHVVLLDVSGITIFGNCECARGYGGRAMNGIILFRS